jgi:hypothetical protein
MQPYEHIVNHGLVTDWFGRWPAFHDAEVLSMHLDRRSLAGGSRPSLAVRLHAFEMTGDVDQRGHYRLVKDAIITLEFGGMEEVSLDGFNCQNVVFQLDFEEAASEDVKPMLDVRFHSSFGVGCAFRSTLARVRSVESGKPSEGPYAGS